MKVVLSAIAFIALSAGVADAATISVAGVFNPNTLLSLVHHGDWTPSVPEPATWGLMILGFTLLARQVRAARKAKA
jgi:hypothetical protein